MTCVFAVRYNNEKVFQGVVKIRKGLSAKLMLSVNDMSDLKYVTTTSLTWASATCKYVSCLVLFLYPFITSSVLLQIRDFFFLLTFVLVFSFHGLPLPPGTGFTILVPTWRLVSAPMTRRRPRLPRNCTPCGYSFVVLFFLFYS
jgi:hypothetical protein